MGGGCAYIFSSLVPLCRAFYPQISLPPTLATGGEGVAQAFACTHRPFAFIISNLNSSNPVRIPEFQDCPIYPPGVVVLFPHPSLKAGIYFEFLFSIVSFAPLKGVVCLFSSPRRGVGVVLHSPHCLGLYRIFQLNIPVGGCFEKWHLSVFPPCGLGPF